MAESDCKNIFSGPGMLVFHPDIDLNNFSASTGFS
jgi:hypothetical protein